MRTVIDPTLTSVEAAERKTDRLIGIGLAAGFFGLYLRTLCPTVYLGDPGDFCTAIVTGGVPHPPGYPLFSLLGRAALAVIPFGEPAFRIGCVVALAAALAVAALYFLAREIGGSPWAAATGAAVFGTGYGLWSQATRVEVYSLHALLVTLLLLAALRYRRTGALCDLAGVALAGSLGLAHHLTIVLTGPAVLMLCGRRLWEESGRALRLTLLAALLPVGPALYLFLLVWARANPLHAWGHTVTLPLLWNQASAHIFRIFLSVPDSPALSRGLIHTGALFRDNFPYLMFVLPVIGAALLWSQRRVAAGALLLAALVVLGYNLCYQIEDVASYYLSVWMIAAAFMAIALDRLRALICGPRPGRAFAAVLAAVLVGAPLARNWSACDLSRATWVREFARQKLEAADPGAVLITQGDSDINPIWYVHDVLKVRPDVIPIDRPSVGGRTWGLYDWDPSLWYLYRLRRQGVDAPLSVPSDPVARAALAQDGYLIQLLSRPLKDRPVCITFDPSGTALSRWLESRYQLLPQGIVLSLHPRAQPIDVRALLRRNEQLWARTPLPDLHHIRTDQEIDPAYVIHQYASMLTCLGVLYQRAGDLPHAEAVYQRVQNWAPDYQPATRLASACLRARTESASRFAHP